MAPPPPPPSFLRALPKWGSPPPSLPLPPCLPFLPVGPRYLLATATQIYFISRCGEREEDGEWGDARVTPQGPPPPFFTALTTWRDPMGHHSGRPCHPLSSSPDPVRLETICPHPLPSPALSQFLKALFIRFFSLFSSLKTKFIYRYIYIYKIYFSSEERTIVRG